MFLYIKNEYNPSPEYFLEADCEPADGVCHVFYAGAPLYTLPATVEEWRQQKKSKYWYNIRRSERMLSDKFAPAHFLHLTRPQEISLWLDRVHDLFLKRWHKSYMTFAWRTRDGFQSYATALLKLAVQGRASLALLVCGEVLLAFSYNLIEGDAFYFYQHAADPDPAYRPFSPGRIFLHQLLQDVIEQKRWRRFDFMVGLSDYKMEWAQTVQKVFVKVARQDYSSEFSYRLHCCFFRTRVFLQRFTLLKIIVKRVMGLLHSHLVVSQPSDKEGSS